MKENLSRLHDLNLSRLHDLNKRVAETRKKVEYLKKKRNALYLRKRTDESEAKEEAFEKILPAFQKKLGDVYMNNLAWMKALKKDIPSIKRSWRPEMIM